MSDLRARPSGLRRSSTWDWHGAVIGDASETVTSAEARDPSHQVLADAYREAKLNAGSATSARPDTCRSSV